jgi:hypothetical protein
MDTDTQYDLIVRMDVMQVIGLDLHNLSKAIVWNGNRVLLSLMVPLMKHNCMIR